MEDLDDWLQSQQQAAVGDVQQAATTIRGSAQETDYSRGQLMGWRTGYSHPSAQQQGQWHSVQHSVQHSKHKSAGLAAATAAVAPGTAWPAQGAVARAVEDPADGTEANWRSKRRRVAIGTGQNAAADAFLPGDSPTEQPPQQQQQLPGNRLPGIISRQPQLSAGGMAAAGARLSQPEPSEACDMDDDVDSEQQEQEGAPAVADDSDDDRDVELVSAEFNLMRDQVIQRIEQLALQLVASASAGQLPELTCISTAASNVHMAQPYASAASQQQQQPGGSSAFNVALGSGMAEGSEQQQGADERLELDDDFGGTAAAEAEPGQRHVLRLGCKTQTRTLTANGGTQAHGIVRVLQLLATVHSLLRAGRTATQRDLYYTLLGPPFFNNSSQLTSAIHTVLALLRLPRAALGIAAASKGAVAGRLLLRFRPGEAWQDCSLTGTAGRAIPGEVGAVQAMQIRVTGARFILVVEKDAVFQRLVEDRLFDKLPCIIVTGRGMPDIASRAFLAALVAAGETAGASGAGSLPVLGLVDWNPGGVAILLSYKHGSAALGLEAARYAVPSLAWLGVHSDMLEDVPSSACQPLTQRDRAQVTNLKPRLDSCPGWAAELEEMQGLGLKVDIEALYGVMGHAGLADELARRVLQRQYLG